MLSAATLFQQNGRAARKGHGARMGHCPAEWHQEKRCADNNLGAGVCRRFILPSKNQSAASTTKYSHIRSQEAIHAGPEAENISTFGLQRLLFQELCARFSCRSELSFWARRSSKCDLELAPVIVSEIDDSASRPCRRGSKRHHHNEAMQASKALRSRQIDRSTRLLLRLGRSRGRSDFDAAA